MTRAAGGQWNDLGPRLVTGVTIAAAGFVAVWLGGSTFHALVAVVVGTIMWELARMIGARRLAVLFGIVAGTSVFVAAKLPAEFALLFLAGPPIVGMSVIGPHRLRFGVYSIAILIGGFGIVDLRDDLGIQWVLWLVLVVVATDVLGYFAGRTIGGPKFWPRISPKKTWSGTAAGWLGAALVGGVFAWLGSVGPEIVALSLAASFASQMGDMAESALKRRLGVKDSSAILPGHGGLWDRFDAMLGASIFVLATRQFVAFPPQPVPI